MGRGENRGHQLGGQLSLRGREGVLVRRGLADSRAVFGQGRETKVPDPPVWWDGKCACVQRGMTHIAAQQRTNSSKQEADGTFFSPPHSHKPSRRRGYRSASRVEAGLGLKQARQGLPTAGRGQWLCEEVRVAYRACMFGRGGGRCSSGKSRLRGRRGSGMFPMYTYFAPRAVEV